MNYGKRSILIRAGGFFGGDPGSQMDQWSSGLKLANSLTALTYDATKLQTLVDAAVTPFKNFHGNVGSYVGTNVYLTYVTAAMLGSDGKYDPPDQDTIRADFTPYAGATTPVHPWNTALVISLRTAYPRGLASNGRVYYPCLGLGVSAATGRAAPTSVDNRIAQFKILIDSLNTLAANYQTGTRVHVMSGGSVTGAPGRSADVQTIRSDTRFDSIERRENEQPAQWSQAAIA